MPELEGQAPRADRRITLPDGRRLGYDERGPSEDRPLLYFHGTPRSRQEVGQSLADVQAERMNVRIIAPTALGLSGFEAGRIIGK